MNRPRIVLADDHRLVAEALKSLLTPEFNLVGIADDGRALVDLAKKLRPDAIVSDITMPKLNGIDALAQLKKDDPSVKVVFLTMHHDLAYGRRALEVGASGFVLKHSAPAELLMAIRAALAGQTFISPALAGPVLQSFRGGDAYARDPVGSLTRRQREVLQLFAEGHSAKEIGAALGISARTVQFHKYQLMHSAHIDNSADLIHFAIRHGLVDL